MIVIIQIHEYERWIDNAFAFYEVKDKRAAENLAFDIANENQSVVRLTYPAQGVAITPQYIYNLPGTYHHFKTPPSCH